MKKVAVLVLYLTVTFGLNAQKAVLIDIAGEQITTEEFDLVYNKNNSSSQAIDPKTREEYLDMYINFKLKVREAEELGMDTVNNFVRELAGYRKQLAAPYLTDSEVTEALIKEAYDRKRQDVNAYHILIQCDANAAPEDTFKAFLECQTIKSNMTDPAKEFKAAARKHSKDPSVAKNGGDLGYFNVFQMVYPFESAAYNTPVGEVSEPIRTRFGYHLIWVKDKRPARGEVHVAHIMVKATEDDSQEEAEKKKQKIDEIHAMLESNGNFEALAKQYSDDKGSGAKGGVLPWFGTGRMVKSFEDAAFELKNDGDFSAPVKTRFGWHIIKRLERKGVPSYDEIKDELKRKVERDGRGNKSKDAFYARTKASYAYKLNAKTLDQVTASIDASYFTGEWKVAEKLSSKPAVLFSLTDKQFIKEKATFTSQDFGTYLQSNKTYQHLPVIDSTVVVGKLYEAFLNEKLTEFEDVRLEAKYPKFKALMQEYHDGILLFDLMDKRVWSMAVEDSVGLNAFYERNKSNYMWDERSDSYVFNCSDSSMAFKAQEMLRGQLDSGINTQLILSELNTESQLSVVAEQGPYSKGENDIVDEMGWKKGFSSILKKDDRWWFVYTNDVFLPQPKALEETKGAVISDYQNELEKEWIADLRLRFKVTVYKENLN